jgi:hypothetical protein
MAHRWRAPSRLVKAVAALAAVGMFSFSPIPLATGQAPLTLEPQDAGYLRLQMDSQASRFRQFDPENALSASQTFKASSCRYTPVAPASGFNLVALSEAPTSGDVGYSTNGSAKYGLGVNTGEGTGKCTQINAPNEALTLRLQNGPGEALEGMYVDAMELDIEAKFNATINIELFRDGVSVGDTFVESCTSSGSDCGPDSADGDNFRVRVPRTGTILFDEMRLFATGSAGSAVVLEAGADGTNAFGAGDPEFTGLGESLGTKDSVFHLVSLGEGVLTCSTGSNLAFEGAAVTLERRSFPGDPSLNPDGSPCIPINYELTRDGNEVEFLKDPTQDPNGSFDIQVDAWDPETAANPIPASTVFPPDPGGESLVWCDGTTADPVMPAGDHYWCLVAQSAELVGSGQMQVTEAVLLEGDARITRG